MNRENRVQQVAEPVETGCYRCTWWLLEDANTCVFEKQDETPADSEGTRCKDKTGKDTDVLFPSRN